MASPYAKTIGNRKQTVQTSPIPGREAEMVKNNAGGYVFNVSDMSFVDRFLILGTEGGTYYQGEKELTEQAATKVKQVIKTNGVAVVNRAAEVSNKGLAHKNDAAIFTMALAATYGDEATKKAVNENLSKVCRTGTHILAYTSYVNSLRGFGRCVRKGINEWYSSKGEDVDNLAYQMVKYQNRNGWKHSDVFRLTHPKFSQTLNNKVVKWIMQKDTKAKPADIIEGFELAKKAENVSSLLKIIEEYELPREAIPTQYLNDPQVWELLLQKGMPMTALLRNLSKMTSVGLLDNKPFNKNVKEILNRLSDKEAIKKARIHPIAVLFALKTYSQGHGIKGSLIWNPVKEIQQALDDAFYLTFDYLEPTGKDIVYGVDVSGSMSWSNSGVLTCAEMAAAMAMALVRSEKNSYIMGFAHNFVDLKINKKDSLQQALKKTSILNFGGTDAAIPFTWGKKEKVKFDACVVLTDNESYAGPIHVTQAIKDYRNWSGNAEVSLAAVGFTATNFSVCDPKDTRQMNFVGMDAELPSAINTFIKM